MESQLLMGDGLRRNAYKFPVKIAAKDRFRQITYGELNSRVNQLAHGLLSLGVRKGDSVAILVGNRIEHLEILFATAKIGADNQDNPVAVNQVGEIICQSPLATEGYYMNPGATSVSFRDGWFYTGDLGYFDEEGYLFVVGRKKDMVKSGGISIYPLEIEGVLYKHPDIVEAAVIGVPDSQWGEAVKAVVVLKEGSPVSGEMLIQFCKEQLAGYKVPKSVDIVAALPHTEIGKVNKAKLKESVLAGTVLV
jgi:acyl-CoA synthetase (AMP-forming)/AMP-acid ligase II